MIIYVILNELERESLPYVNKCNHPLCQCCTSITECNNFQSTRTGHTFPIEINMNCNSYTIIYLITCSKCKLQCVGETYRKLKDRLNDHKSNVWPTHQQRNSYWNLFSICLAQHKTFSYTTNFTNIHRKSY